MIAFLALCVAAPFLDEIPLRDPALTQAVKPAEAPSAIPGALQLGLFAQGGLGTATERGFAGGGLELGYRLPFLARRLGFAASPSLGALFAGAESLWLALPLGVTLHQSLGPGLLRARAALSFDYVSSRALLQDGTALDRAWSVAFDASLGYVFPLPHGGCVLELVYHLLPMRIAQQGETAHLVGLRVGYTFFLF